MSKRGAGGVVGRRLIELNRRPFGRPEAAFYEFLAAPAVRNIVTPVLEHELQSAPPGPVLDVGCGSGAIASRLRRSGRVVVGVDPSIPQLARLRRRHATLPRAAATAAALPVRPGSFAAVVSSCAVKHWPSRVDGLEECASMLRPGGRLILVEIDGGDDRADLLRFAAHTRIPRGLRRLYPAFARRSFVPLSPTAEQLVADCADAGLSSARSWRLGGLPFLVVTASRP